MGVTKFATWKRLPQYRRAMRIGFVGDVAIPESFSFPSPEWGDAGVDFLVINLEGAPVRQGTVRIPDGSASSTDLILYNREDALKDLRNTGVRVATLANNHILDTGRSVAETRATLLEYGIAPVGAGQDLYEATRPAAIAYNGREAIFLAHGWSAIECVPAGVGQQGTAPLDRELVLSQIRSAREDSPSATIFFIAHWGFTLERYPHPGHRELAHLAIDAGADAVIGHHPHCIQGVEEYRGCPIVYSLGNWFLPQGNHFGRRIAYPDYAAEQLAFVWDEDGEHVLHYSRYDSSAHQVMATSSDPFSSRERLREVSQFEGMGLSEYDAWFREHRSNRSFLLPTIGVGEAGWVTKGKERWIQVRHMLLLAVMRAGLGSFARKYLGRAARTGEAG